MQRRVSDHFLEAQQPCCRRTYGCRRRGPRPDAAVPAEQAAVAHAKSPMQMMAARQQLMAAKSRQDAERMQFNCF